MCRDHFRSKNGEIFSSLPPGNNISLYQHSHKHLSKICSVGLSVMMFCTLLQSVYHCTSYDLLPPKQNIESIIKPQILLPGLSFMWPPGEFFAVPSVISIKCAAGEPAHRHADSLRRAYIRRSWEIHGIYIMGHTYICIYISNYIYRYVCIYIFIYIHMYVYIYT